MCVCGGYTTDRETVRNGGIYKTGGEGICFLTQLADLIFMISLSVNEFSLSSFELRRHFLRAGYLPEESEA